MTKQSKKPASLPYVALLLAWLVPGAGHAYLGRWARGIIIFVTISGLFWTGIAVGGVMTVDYRNERYWFLAEMFAGVHGLVGWYRQRAVYQRLDISEFDTSAESDEKLDRAGLALVAPSETVARAYSGIAGLLNVMCMFDALMLSVMGVFGEKPAPKGKAESKAA